MFKKIQKILLSIIISLTAFSNVSMKVSANELVKEAYIVHSGTKISEIDITESEKKTVYVEVVGIEPTTYQWQISNDNSSWFDIYDKTDESCDVSYALLKELLNQEDSAYVRCMVKDDESTIYTNIVKTKVTFTESTTPNVKSFAFNENIISEKKVSTQRNMFMMSRATPEYVTITVKYLDHTSLDTGIEAAIYSPYVATIDYNSSSFSDEIIAPTFLGFAPYYDENEDGILADDEILAESIFDINITTNITTNIEYKIYYKPINVKYQIRYFFQNINDDLYTENVGLHHQDEALTGTIIEESTLQEHAGDTTGFTKLYHIPESVAADGSTIFECYYDRNYYTIQFDLNEGYGVEPIYARYETPFIVNNPIRAGYTFIGWDLVTIENPEGDGIEDELPATIPHQNLKYKAIWVENVNNSSATVVYWLQEPEKNENGTYDYVYFQDEKITGLTVGQTIDAVNYKTITGYTWYEDLYVYNAKKTEEQDEKERITTVNGDGSSVVNVYLDRRDFTLRFIVARQTGSRYQAAIKSVLTDTVEGINYKDRSWENITLKNETDWNTFKNNLSSQSIDGYTYYFYEQKYKYGSLINTGWGDINGELNSNILFRYRGLLVTWDAYFTSWLVNKDEINGVYPYLDKKLLTVNTKGSYDDIQYLTAYYVTNGIISGFVDSMAYYKYEIYFDINDTDNYENIYNDSLFNKLSPVNQTTPEFSGMHCHLKEYYFNGTKYDESSIGTPSTSSTNPVTIKMYYKPASFNLQFYNYNTIVDDLTISVKYNKTIKEYQPSIDKIPYPNDLEENAYKFVGWYTSPGCYDGTEVDWENTTMSSSDMLLYAKWEKVKHTVRFFENYNDMIAYEKDNSLTPWHTTNEILHGNVINETIPQPTNVDAVSGLEFIFAGWFYMDNGVKKAFTPYDIPINKDLLVFADWSSTSPQPYRISYVLDNDHDIHVAPDSEGFAYCGTTRTFVAKAGNPYNQLDEAYNNGYFPTVSSHSITLQYEEHKDNPLHNLHTFYYVHAANIEYTIRYVNKVTNVVMEEITNTTSNAVVTERFKSFEGMVPDAFYKRLVISVEYDGEKWVGSEDNVITFYYTPNATSAYYAVHYMKEKLDATDSDLLNYNIDGSGGYELSGTAIEGIGDIGGNENITPVNFDGFSLIEDKAKSVVNGVETNVPYTAGKYTITITKEGTVLYVFYKRNTYEYNVHYYKYNTTNPLVPSKNGSGKYQSSVTESAVSIPGYTCVTTNTSKTITIKPNLSLNEIVYYYAPIEYVVEYISVPNGAGILSNTIEVINGSKDFSGSVATANSMYKFIGWFADEDCTISADAYGTIVGDKFTPDKNKISDIHSNKFYAKFELKAGNLTIQRKDVEDTNQVFVYVVQNTDSTEKITVSVVGEEPVTIYGLIFGDYTITQLNPWSWRYEDVSMNYIHENANSSVTFEKEDGETINTQWLNGNSGKKKIKGG